MTTARQLALRAAAGLLCALLPLASALAATASAQAGATVIVPVPVNAWLGAPVSVQDLLLAHDAPPGPATGDLVTRVPSPTTPAQLLARPAWIAQTLDGRQAFGIDSVPPAAAALLPRGPAAAVSVAAADGGDGDAPLVITVAFN